MVGLREVINTEEDPQLRGALLLVLSAILIKVSRQRSETAAGVVERTIGKGLPTRLFQRKAAELVERMEALSKAVPAGTSPPDVRIGDARRLEHIADRSMDVLLTSPPYLGTYDYAEQHVRRFGWLGLDARRFSEIEIGARRRTTRPGEAMEQWQKDVNAFVIEIARVLSARGRAYIVIGDSALGTQVVPGDEAIRMAANAARLVVIASAWQLRPNFHAPVGRQDRREHLIALTAK